MNIHNAPHYVNPIPSPNVLSALWHELSSLADVVPEGQRPGLARARTRLLDGIPNWRLPAVLDDLTTEGAPA